MKRRITRLLHSLSLASIFLAPLAMAEIGPYATKLSPDGKLGIMGDSMALGVHTSEMCGNVDAYECAQQALGSDSPDWSYAAADKSWSIASLLGFDAAHRVAAFEAGEKWKDALDQAMAIMADPAVEAVFIGLGGNNVCTPRGHDYTGDLDDIAGHIDATLGYLTDTLPPGGRIYWSGVLDVLQLHDLMRDRDHNFWFESCQGTWDLDDNKVKDEAANDLCDHFFSSNSCQVASVIEEAKDEFLNLLLNLWHNLEGVDAGPCGKVLSSRSTNGDRAEAREFNLALNQLRAAKAAEYHGRNGVAVYYSDHIFEASSGLRPYHVSRLDCFHPSRAGQLFLANETWRGFDPLTEPASLYFFDEFDSQDYCDQEYTTWDTCWIEIGEDNGPTAGDIQINVRELRVRDNNKGIMRSLDLEGMQAAWLQYNWRRESLDNGDDYVSIDVSPDAGQTWYKQERLKGDGDDFNTHRGYYHDITPYATADTWIRFKGSQELGGHDKVFFDNITVLGWGVPMLIQDTDQDGLLDSAEDRNGNGFVDFGETDPLDSDSDDDGLLDGTEDRNGNGIVDIGETDPLDSDSDDDGLIDGIETNTGIFINASDTGTDPNNSDTDGDGFDDAVEVIYDSDPHNNTDTPPDSNGDGIFDKDAIFLGLDPNKPDGDSDNDGSTDVDEVGDVHDPVDNDADGVIDALEPGDTANNAEIASGLPLASGDSVIIETVTGGKLSKTSSAMVSDGPPGINFPVGTISFTTTAPPGGAVTIRFTFSVDLPADLKLFKVDSVNKFTELPNNIWTLVNNRTVTITLTDGNPLTDLDSVVNGSIDDPLGPGVPAPAGIGGGGGGGGGGCTIGTDNYLDPTFLFILFILSMGYIRGHLSSCRIACK
jgi:hypothetical protein